MDITKLDELARIRRRTDELYNEGELIDMSCGWIHLSKKAFSSVFTLEECTRRELEDYGNGKRCEVSAVYDGVKFFCWS